MHWLVVVQSVAFITKERSVLSLYSNHLPGTWRNSLRWRVISHSAKRKHSRYSEVWCCNCKLCIILEHASSTFFRDCPFSGRRILLGQIETFLQWNGEIYWDSHDIKWNKCISHGIKNQPTTIVTLSGSQQRSTCSKTFGSLLPQCFDLGYHLID